MHQDMMLHNENNISFERNKFVPLTLLMSGMPFKAMSYSSVDSIILRKTSSGILSTPSESCEMNDRKCYSITESVYLMIHNIF